MIKDTLVLSDKYFNFLEVIHNPEDYMKLDDNIVNIIENFETDDTDLLKAKDLMRRIKFRDVYKFIGEISIEQIDLEKAYNDLLCLDNPGNLVKREDIELKLFSIDYGFGSKNPFEHTYFYKPEDTSRYFTCSAKNISLMFPSTFKENYLRVFCKDRSKAEQVSQMFEKYKKLLKKLSFDITPIKVNEKNLISNKREREVDLNKIN